jgi:hypothetical protein
MGQQCSGGYGKRKGALWATHAPLAARDRVIMKVGGLVETVIIRRR